MEYLTREQELKAASDRGRPVPAVKKTEPKKDWCIRMPRKYWREALKGLNPTERCLLISLRDYSGPTASCWPSLRTLAAELSVSVKSARRHLKILEEKGHLKIVITKKGYWNKWTYILKFL